MAKPIAPDYGQQFIFPPALEEWVPQDHPVRFLREFVDQRDLAQLGFAIPQASEGRPPYAPSLLLKIWLYGYLHRIRSLRKLEAACRDHLALLWLTGMIAPDHNSLWRFWRDNKAALRRLFKESVEVAVNAGLVGLALQALDGTKIQALASPHTGWTKAHMQKLLAAVETELKQTEEQLEQEIPAAPQSGYELPKKLQDKEALRQAVKAGLQQLEEDGRQHYHPKEPEARRMKCEGRKPFAYNAQAVVDEQHGVVVAAEVCREEEDSSQLVGLVEQAQQNTGASTAVLTVADCSYGSGGQLAQAAERNLQVLVHPQLGNCKKPQGYRAADFHYEVAHRTVLCPQKHLLRYLGSAKQKGQTVQRYRCDRKDCPVASLCQDSRGRRIIEVWPHTPVVQAMREQLKTRFARESLAKRGRIIEKHFGHLKQQDGFRRWTVRGSESVRTQWALLNLTMNLRVLAKHWATQNKPMN
jgi:transposase